MAFLQKETLLILIQATEKFKKRLEIVRSVVDKLNSGKRFNPKILDNLVTEL